MAATYLTIGSKFKPYSFEEYVKPLNMYKEEYQRQEDLYNTYAETAGLIGADLNPALDSDILNNTYNPYMQALSSGADTLATEGLTPGGRKQLQELRRRFGREITPIKVASEARTKARENWDKMLAQDKTLMTNANPYYQGISAYMNGASPDTTYVSGNELYSRGQALTKALSNVLRQVPSGEDLSLGDQYFRIAQEKGFNSDEMKDFLDRVVKTNPELESQINKIMQSSGIYNKGFTEADINRAKQYIIEGMASGMSGETEVDYLENRQWDLDRTPSPTDEPENPSVGKIPWGINTSLLSQYNEASAFRDKLTKEGYTPAKFEGAEYMVPGYLKAQLKYIEDPEFKTEYDRMRSERYTELAKHYGVGNPDIDQTNAAKQVEAVLNEEYPLFPPEKSIRRQLEKTQEELAPIFAKYGHLSTDKSEVLRLGAALEVAQYSEPIGAYTYKFDPTYVNKIKDNVINNPSRIFEYSKETGSVGKQISVKDKGAFSDKIMEAYSDFKGRQIVTTKDGKSYFVEGDIDQQLKQKQIEALRASFSYFGNDEKGLVIPSVSGNIIVPGIGSLEERMTASPESIESLITNPGRYNFKREIENGYAKPIISKGDILFYRLAIDDRETRIPYVVTITSSGNAITVSNPEWAAMGGTPMEDQILTDYAGLVNTESGETSSKKP